MRIKPAQRITGSVRVPGDKSISHRAAIIASLASGVSVISNFSTSKDCAATVSCLQQLGVVVERAGNTLHIQGRGADGLSASERALDCGNSGSTMRMLAGVLAGQDFSSTLTGDDSLLGRPMSRVIRPLEMMGASIDSKQGCAPLIIHGRRPLKAITYELPVASAQVKTCILLGGLNATGRTEVVDPSGIPTRDHTERLFSWFGVKIEAASQGHESLSWALEGPATFTARDVQIPGDFSSAAFLIAAAAVLPGSDLKIENLGLNSTRTQFLNVLERWGAAFEVTELRDEFNEPTGRLGLRNSGPNVRPMEIRGAMVAELIDELPLLAVLGSQFGGISIREAGELRVKESDRIAATANNLRAMGATVQEHDDGLTVSGPVKLRGASVDSFGDHRIAMAFAVAALFAEGETEIRDSDCVEVSFPNFFEVLESIVER